MIIWIGWRKKDDVSIKWFMARKLMAVDLVDRIRGRLKSSLPAAVPLTSHSSTTINHAPCQYILGDSIRTECGIHL